jgi:hypothetical protein
MGKNMARFAVKLRFSFHLGEWHCSLFAAAIDAVCRAYKPYSNTSPPQLKNCGRDSTSCPLDAGMSICDNLTDMTMMGFHNGN